MPCQQFPYKERIHCNANYYSNIRQPLYDVDDDVFQTIVFNECHILCQSLMLVSNLREKTF